LSPEYRLGMNFIAAAMAFYIGRKISHSEDAGLVQKVFAFFVNMVAFNALLESTIFFANWEMGIKELPYFGAINGYYYVGNVARALGIAALFVMLSPISRITQYRLVRQGSEDDAE